MSTCDKIGDTSSRSKYFYDIWRANNTDLEIAANQDVLFCSWKDVSVEFPFTEWLV